MEVIAAAAAARAIQRVEMHNPAFDMVDYVMAMGKKLDETCEMMQQLVSSQAAADAKKTKRLKLDSSASSTAASSTSSTAASSAPTSAPAVEDSPKLGDLPAVHATTQLLRHRETVERFLQQEHVAIRKILLDQPHRTDPNFAKLITRGRGMCSIARDVRAQYKLPQGIHGTNGYRDRTQNFRICFKGKYLVGRDYGLQSDYTNFRDPRDAGEVVNKLEVMYMAFLHK
jgi:hypothetical protein